MLRQSLEISQGSVATHLRWGWIFSDILLQIFSHFLQWNNSENRLIHDKVEAYKLWCQFWGSPCTSQTLLLMGDIRVEASLKHILYTSYSTGFRSGRNSAATSWIMRRIQRFSRQTTTSFTLRRCLPMKLFQLAMGVQVFKTDVFEFNFLNCHISETTVYFAETRTFYTN